MSLCVFLCVCVFKSSAVFTTFFNPYKGRGNPNMMPAHSSPHALQQYSSVYHRSPTISALPSTCQCENADEYLCKDVCLVSQCMFLLNSVVPRVSLQGCVCGESIYVYREFSGQDNRLCSSIRTAVSILSFRVCKQVFVSCICCT